MDWLRKEEIMMAIMAAPDKQKDAIDWTILHWEQILAAGSQELIDAKDNLLSGDICGLCIYKDIIKSGCPECILGQYVGPCSQGNKFNPWYPALKGFKHLRMGLINLWNFRRRVKRMLKVLRKIRKQLRRKNA